MGACLPVVETRPFLSEQRGPGQGQVPGQEQRGQAASMGAGVSGRSTAPYPSLGLVVHPGWVSAFSVRVAQEDSTCGSSCFSSRVALCWVQGWALNP